MEDKEILEWIYKDIRTEAEVAGAERVEEALALLRLFEDITTNPIYKDTHFPQDCREMLRIVRKELKR